MEKLMEKHEISKDIKESDSNVKVPIANWILEHVRPHVGWVDGKSDDADLEKINDIGDSLEYIKDHIEIGIKFKFKF